MIYKQIILFSFLILTISLTGQTNAHQPSILNDTLWAKANFFKAQAKFISIEKYPLLPCGYIRDHTLAQFKIISTNNSIVNLNTSYTFYVSCNTFQTEPIKNEVFSVEGILKFNENDSLLKNANSFKGDDPNRIYLLNLKRN
jgi:hypothetical protein